MSPDSARCGLTCRSAASDNRWTWPGAALVPVVVWLPVRLPGISLATLTLGYLDLNAAAESPDLIWASGRSCADAALPPSHGGPLASPRPVTYNFLYE